DLLRLEMGYPLHGSDIDESTNPLEAGLGWLIDWDKAFTGSDALAAAREAGVSRKLSGLVGRGREIPRAGCAVLRGGEKIGEVTSGNFSPVLRTGVALAYLPADAASPGTLVEIDVRGRMLPAEVVKPPFIRT
ncbi:MAG: glycine cleavage T C-terminal barrel domain-containing protein, partial [Actinomycetota bacterium]